MENYISKFKESIKILDIRQAKELLLDFYLQSEEEQAAILNELAMISDHEAWILLDFIVKLEIEHHKSLSANIYNKLIQLIVDRAHLNFEFALILYKTHDKKNILQAASLIKYILTNCTDRVVLFDAIVAVGDETIESLVDVVAEFLYYDDVTLKTQAIKSLKKIGNTKVHKILSDVSKTAKSDQNILDALSSLKSSTSAEEIQSYSSSLIAQEVEQEQEKKDPQVEEPKIDIMAMLKSKSIEERFKAFKHLLEADKSSDELILKELAANLESDNHDLVINTLKIISHRASDELLPDIYSFLNKKNLASSFEHEAFEALCSFEKFSFTELMMDSIEKSAIDVRMSAIKALDKNYNDPVYAKVKNRVETGRGEGQALARSIVDAQANNLINYLLVSDAFADIASTYLTKDATPSALHNYLNILTKRGFKATAKKIRFKADMASRLKNHLTATVISTSDTLHKIYEKLLFKNGYIVVGFKNPEDAFEKISVEKPDLIVSDLFLSEMTALDFAREVREFYNNYELPFLISTNQSDFIGLDLEKEYSDCKVSSIFRFPEIVKAIG
ncbi:MAG: response regulator [Desulfamplus sp.]|nr:response regulator [Desulfamplus sp.]MBF0390341.1 response regulator [Desulfamplus sp.]